MRSGNPGAGKRDRGSRCRSARGVIGAALVGAAALAGAAPSAPRQTDDPALPVLDVRLDAADLPTAAVLGAIPKDRAARRADIARLAGRVPLVAVDDDALLGTPHFVRSTVAYLTGPLRGSVQDVAAAFAR